VRDQALNDEICALKILDPCAVEDETDIYRFRSEVLITRKLTHPNIVRTFEFGTTPGGQHFITMEFINGKSLDRIIQSPERAELPIREIVRLLHEIAKGIACAHEKGIIHRDLTPANIMVGENGEVKVTDFGFARPVAVDFNITQAGHCVGTPSYMAPEQIRGENASPRCDVYALGIIAFELISGKLPFTADDWMTLGQKVLNDPLPPISTALTKVPPWYENFVRKAAAKHPADRYQSAHEIETLLAKHLEDTSAEYKQISNRSRAARTATAVTEISSAMFFSFSRHTSMFLVVAFMAALLVSAAAIPKIGSARQPRITEQLQEKSKMLNDIAATLERLNRLAGETYRNRQQIDTLLQEAEKNHARSANGSPTSSPTPSP
ncbi:MAG TPA: serine/threonine-protein kinase, partial [Oligoflexia bacterium]|nr:serine/threonine-protein kinase [Oligoflexia bacterium]